jgi:YHS domain-containing protein
MKNLHRIALAALLAAGLTTTLRAEDKPAAPAAEKAAAAKEDYPLTTCVVSGEKLGEMGDPYVLQYEGKTVKFCCKDCVKKFKKDPAKYLAKIEEAAKAKAAKTDAK